MISKLHFPFLWFIIIFCIFPSCCAIKCVQCEELECTYLNFIPTECPLGIRGCVSILTEQWSNSERFSVRRDCFTEELSQFCTPDLMASQICDYCDHVDGCNVEKKDPLICANCDLTLGERGYICESFVICHPLFRTVSPACHVSWDGPNKGTHYGCWHRINFKSRRAQVKKDPANFYTTRCDSHYCNSGLHQLFDNHTELLEQPRFCFRGDENSIVHCRNFVYSEPLVSFCIYSASMRATNLSYMRNHDCMGDVYKQPQIIRPLFIDNGDAYICNYNGCNHQKHLPYYACYGVHMKLYYVFKSSDACVMYNDPRYGYQALGRLHANPCTDPLRCFICRFHKCNTEVNLRRTFCYETDGPQGNYIRRGQLEHMNMCDTDVHRCVTVFTDESVWRGCEKSNLPEDAIFCKGNLCNHQSRITYCFVCHANDPNCVFSQGDNSLFEVCGFPFTGCFTQIFKDGSVQRGCAEKDLQAENMDSIYSYCYDEILCNGKTTQFTSCHLVTTLIYKKPVLPEFVPRQWETNQGVNFETCADELGLPACYTRTYYRNKEPIQESGCTNDISVAAFVNFRRGYYDLSFVDTVLCDGHYCNVLPIEGKLWIKDHIGE